MAYTGGDSELIKRCTEFCIKHDTERCSDNFNPSMPGMHKFSVGSSNVLAHNGDKTFLEPTMTRDYDASIQLPDRCANVNESCDGVGVGRAGKAKLAYVVSNKSLIDNILPSFI